VPVGKVPCVQGDKAWGSQACEVFVFIAVAEPRLGLGAGVLAVHRAYWHPQFAKQLAKTIRSRHGRCFPRNALVSSIGIPHGIMET
jgi:hypothetical protein